MSDWRPLSARNGQKTDIRFNSDGSCVVRAEQNVDGFLERNKALRGNTNRGYIGDGTFRRVASIPINIVHKWLQEGIDIFSGDQQAELARKLNDPDNAYLRTSDGRIGVSNGVAR